MRRVEDRQVRVAFVNAQYEQEEEAYVPMPTQPTQPGHPSMHAFFKSMAKEQHVGLGVLCFQLLYEYYLIATGQPHRGLWQELINTAIDKTLAQREQSAELYPLPKKKKERIAHSDLDHDKKTTTEKKEGPTQ